ncbi:unnamed protein product [Rotaria magnacalcarata]|uniref:HAT C-terminal dimerisation domain-containing protein n=1 Tax=Rotaria magnacalcarata TaxID=392030 RepID=A0A8S3IQK3_9BILA|nr:unnamed protein product [Rotaria magnacalcarata]
MQALRSEINDYQGEYVSLTNKKRLISLCDTRWVDRNTSIETFLELYIPIINTLDNGRLSSLKCERIILLSKLRPELILRENSFELSKSLSKQFADRLPSPLQLNSELERWQKKCNDLLKMNEEWKKKWINELIKEADHVLFPNVRFLLIFLATLPVSTASAERSFSKLSSIKTYH